MPISTALAVTDIILRSYMIPRVLIVSTQVQIWAIEATKEPKKSSDLQTC